MKIGELSFLLILFFVIHLTRSEFNLKTSKKSIEERFTGLKENTIELLGHQYDFKQNINDEFKNNLNKVSCVDPSDEWLTAMLVGFMNQYDQFNGILNFKHVKNEIYKKFIDNTQTIKNEILNFDNNVCNVKSNFTKLNELAICPYHFKIIDRIDRIPHLRSQAICDCTNCTRGPLHDDAIYRCMPITILVPALKRDNKVCIQGVHIWKPILEYVSIACECKKLDSSGLIDIE